MRRLEIAGNGRRLRVRFAAANRDGTGLPPGGIRTACQGAWLTERIALGRFSRKARPVLQIADMERCEVMRVSATRRETKYPGASRRSMPSSFLSGKYGHALF